MLDIAIIAWIVLVAMTLMALARCQADGLGHRHLISANGVFLMTMSLYFVVPALNPILTGGRFFWAAAYSGDTIVVVVMCSLVWAVMVYLLGYQLNAGPSTPVADTVRPLQLNPIQTSSRAVILAFIMIVVGILMKLVAIRLGGGVEETVMRMSRGVAETRYITGLSAMVGHLRNLSGISEAGAAYLLLEALRTGRARWLGFAIFVAVVGLAMMTTGKRLYILWPVLIAAAGYSCYVKVLRPKYFLVLLPLGLGFGFLTLMYRIYAPLYFAGSLPGFDVSAAPWSQGSLWLFYFNSLEFSFFELTAASFIDHETITRILGGPLLAFYRPHIEPIFYIIPRAIWPGKPETLVDISHAMTAMVFNSDLFATNLGIASGLTGTSYILGGFFGYTAAFFALGLLCRRIDRAFIGSRIGGEQVAPMRIVWLAFWMVVVFHFFRQGTIGWVFMITVVQQMGLLVGFAAITIAPRLTWRHGQRARHV